jgi:hypothetical protein
LAGAREAGKTYFLLSLISNLLNPKEPLEALLDELELKFEFATNLSKHEFKKLSSNAAMAKLKGNTPPPDLTAEPFDLLIHKNIGSEKQNFILTIFNSSGELYNSPGLNEIPKTPLRHEVKDAHVMLVFVDPIHDRGLSDLLNENHVLNSRMILIL